MSKKFIVEQKMNNNTDGYYQVVVEGENHLNKTVIRSDIQFFTRQSGYDYNHPEQRAKEYADKIAAGLNGIVIGSDVFIKINDEVKSAKAKHTWKESPGLFKQAAILAEETGEVAQAVLKHSDEGGSVEDIEKELIQVAAVCVRMIETIHSHRQSVNNLQTKLGEHSKDLVKNQ